MNRRRIEEMLQDCLTGFDAGLSPEECLSAYPQHRRELEPLFREAISLRVAFATSPRAEFREQARERLLFAAGRDVSVAFARQPDSEFVNRTRDRLVAAAGAEAQEALRSIPPPRMPFWLNARRRLLDAAQAPRPAPRPAVSMAMRTSLSAAVVVLALFVAGLAYFTGANDQPTSVSAQYAALEKQLQEVEQAAAGGTLSTDMVDRLTESTLNLTQQLETEHDAEIVEKLPAVIQRQQEVVRLASSDSSIAPDLELAKARLDQAEARISAARLPDGSEDQQTSASPASDEGVIASASATATIEVSPTATPPELRSGQLRISAAPDDTLFDINWVRIATVDLSLHVPNTWRVVGVTLDGNGTANLDTNLVRIDSPDASVILFIQTDSGAIQAILGDRQVGLRGAGNDAAVISLTDLVDETGALAPILSHMLDTLSVSGDLAGDPEPAPTATATEAPTNTPEPTETAVPTETATPEPSPTATP